jgi:hypothetical protein
MPLDVHLGSRRRGKKQRTHRRRDLQERPVCHLCFTGVDQVVTVLGGRQVPASPRHGTKNRDRQHQKQCHNPG